MNHVLPKLSHHCLLIAQVYFSVITSASSLQHDFLTPHHMHYYLAEPLTDTVNTITTACFLYSTSHCLELIIRNAFILYLSPFTYQSNVGKGLASLVTTEPPECKILLNKSKHLIHIS